MHSARFDSKKTNLIELLRDVDSGKLQLPDFQRDWVWGDARIRSLLGSISVSFPIGAIMTLETGGEASFLPRPMEGVTDPITPERLLLDGQQRLTALYQTLFSRAAVNTRDTQGKTIKRRYYIDMRKALDENVERDEWIISVPEDGIVRTRGNVVLDVSTPDLEYEQHLFPANRIFVEAAQSVDEADWLDEYVDGGGDPKLRTQFRNQVVNRLRAYELPVIELGRTTPKDAICLVFEKVNTGAVVLTVFELLTAMFAAHGFQLREDWNARKENMAQTKVNELLTGVTREQFLQAVTLLATLERRRKRKREEEGVSKDALPAVGASRRNILDLTLAEYKTWAGVAESGLVEAAKFLVSQNIYAARDIPYQTQLVPLAAILADTLKNGLGKKTLAAKEREKLARWYWCGVFGEMYAEGIEVRFARDLTEVPAWIHGAGTEPGTIAAPNFQANRLLTLRRRNSAAYKGVHALLIKEESRDFQTGRPVREDVFFDDAIDIHHIFPESWCKKRGIPRETYNSIINKTALSAHTNRHVIGGAAPSQYLAELEGGIGERKGVSRAKLDEILRTHAIPIDEIRADDFWGFFAKRAEELRQLIEKATGKPIARDPAAFLSGAPIEEYVDADVDSVAAS